VAKTARAEVNADPDTILLIDEEIDVMVTRADRSKLSVGLLA
jgi:hypothetical protein